MNQLKPFSLGVLSLSLLLTAACSNSLPPSGSFQGELNSGIIAGEPVDSTELIARSTVGH